MNRILIVEDETIIRAALRRLLERHQYQVAEAASVDGAERQHDLQSFNLIITDLRLPGSPGTELIGKAPGIPVLIMTSYASLRSAVDSMKMGAVDYIAKPFDHEEMLDSVQSILSRQQESASQSSAPAGEERALTDMIFGDCSAMHQLFNLIGKVAPTDTTVLIQGESGTGKELAAQAIHKHSARAQAPLISVNCAAIPETLIESELFGHEKGAFTGAVSARNGLVEAADGGTLFLDEIGELPLEAQARLLRVLQEGEIRRVGSTQAKQVDVRLIAATHRNLKALSKTGEFREDLYYRLNVMQIKIPPLRERGEDILGLANRFLIRQAEKLNKAGLALSPEAMQLINQYNWPGNVRELENAIERAVILTDQPVIIAELLGVELDRDDIDLPERFAHSELASARSAPEPVPAELSLEDYFQRFVLENQDKMSETELAQKLGISRKSLWERRQRLGIPRKRSSTP